MNYYDARERADHSGWHYTVMRNGVVRPAGACADHPPHATEDEARDCFRAWLLEGARFDGTSSDWTGCKICDAPTKRYAETRPPLGNAFPLCDEHRTPEVLADLTPMPGQIMASW
jgi:hypothetical protein